MMDLRFRSVGGNQILVYLNGDRIGWVQYYKNPPIEATDGNEHQWVFHTQTGDLENFAVNTLGAVVRELKERLEPIYVD